MSYDRFESQNRKRAMQNRSLAGKMYFAQNNLQSASPTQPPQKPEADNGSAVASKLPTAAASSAVGKTLRALVCIALTLLGGSSFASPADGRWLDAVALVESSNDSSAIGDGGRARGAFQFHRDAWEVARRLNPAVVEYVTGSTNAAQSRLAAAAYLTWLRQRFAANGVTMPTAAQLYAAYNCGFASFKRRGFDVSRCPKITQRACARIEKKIAALSRGAATK